MPVNVTRPLRAWNPGRISGRANGSLMSLATVSASPPASAPAAGGNGHPAAAAADAGQLLQLPGPPGRLRDDRRSSARRSTSPIRSSDGWRLVNLIVFAIASAISGPIADRIGPRKVIFAGVAVWSDRHHRARRCRTRSRCCCSSARWSASARAPTARAPTRCCARPRRPKSAAARSASTTSAWRSAATSGLVLGTLLAPHHRLARGVLDRGRSVDAARASVGVRGGAGAPRLARRSCPRAPTCSSPTYLIALGGRHPGDLRRQRADLLVAVADHRGAPLLRSSSPASSWPCVGPGLRRRAASSRAATWATRSTARARGGHALAIGLSMLAGRAVRRRGAAGHRTSRRSWC